MVSVKLLRTLGYLKITDLESDISIMTNLNNQLCDLDIKAWSVPDKYVKHDGNVGYEAMKNLLEGYVGVSVSTEVTNIHRRTFKNTWNLIWKNYCSAVSYPENVGVILSELGLRLAFVTSDDRSTMVAKSFYNDIINWFLYTAQSVDTEKTLRTLVVSGISDMRRLYDSNNS